MSHLEIALRFLDKPQAKYKDLLYVTFMSHLDVALRFPDKLWTPQAEYKANHYFVHPLSKQRVSTTLHQRISRYSRTSVIRANDRLPLAGK
jgi:hypothetical protein